MKPFSIPSIYSEYSYIPESSIAVNAIDHFNTALVNLLQPIKITFHIEKVKNIFKPETLSFFFWNPLSGQWKKMETHLEIENNQISTTADHLSNFAVFGEKLDSAAPNTNIEIIGTTNSGWYKAQPVVTLTSDAIEDLAFYSIDNNDWQEFTTPFSPDIEGVFTIQYRSMDPVENIESVKDILLRIDTQKKWKNTVKIKQNSFILAAD